MKKSITLLLFGIFTLFLGTFSVSASSYSNDNDLLNNSTADNLIRLANSQIKNFTNNGYAVFTYNNNYYLISSKDYEVNGNTITFNDSTIISCTRTGNYGSYTYSTNTETSTTLSVNHILISNIDTNYSATSLLFNDLKFNDQILHVSMFILGIAFCFMLIGGKR